MTTRNNLSKIVVAVPFPTVSDDPPPFCQVTEAQSRIHRTSVLFGFLIGMLIGIHSMTNLTLQMHNLQQETPKEDKTGDSQLPSLTSQRLYLVSLLTFLIENTVVPFVTLSLLHSIVSSSFQLQGAASASSSTKTATTTTSTASSSSLLRYILWRINNHFLFGCFLGLIGAATIMFVSFELYALACLLLCLVTIISLLFVTLVEGMDQSLATDEYGFFNPLMSI